MRCATVIKFEALLRGTSDDARRARANSGAIDASGAAAIFETSHRNLVRIDAKVAPGSAVPVRTAPVLDSRPNQDPRPPARSPRNMSHGHDILISRGPSAPRMT